MKLFSSDNVTGACPEVMDAVIAANQGDVPSYGHDTSTDRLQSLFSEVFETAVAVFPALTGTASNALALSAVTPPYGKVYCHRRSHVYTDECCAPEFFTGGAKLLPVQGAMGKIAADDLAAEIHGTGIFHHAQPATVSITQACETGLVYGVDEIAAIGEVARANGLRVHMDGARFANALVTLDASPAEMTWKAGVDVLSFGGTKNGCLAAEAVIFFDKTLAGSFPYLQKRSGQLLSKMWSVSVQLEAYLTSDVWLRNARNANAMANRLSRGLAEIPGVELPYRTQSNEVFARLPGEINSRLTARGWEINAEELEGTAPPRFVTSWNTRPGDVDHLLAAISEAAGNSGRETVEMRMR